MQALDKLRSALDAASRSAGVFVRDVGPRPARDQPQLAGAVGLAVVAVVVFAVGNADLRQQVETHARDWLQTRHEARAEASGNVLVAVRRARRGQPCHGGRPAPTCRASRPRWRNGSRAATRWRLSRSADSSRKPGPIGQRAGLDPTLILAIMAIESSFNPFAQSPVGAQGLMQVMTRVHDDKYEPFGGNHAAFDPVTNLRVGVQVLKECIARAGSLEAGLRFYVGAGQPARRRRLRRAGAGRTEPPSARGRRQGRAVQCPVDAGRRPRRLPPRAPPRRPRRRRPRRSPTRARPTSAWPCCDRSAPLHWRPARLAIGPHRRDAGPEVADHRGAQAGRHGRRPPFAWAALDRHTAWRHPKALHPRRGLPCSTVPNPPLPASTRKSGPRSRPRTAARKSTSSSSPRRTTPARR